MKKIQLGNSDIQIAPLAFGGNVFGWTIDQNTSFTLLDAFENAGFNLIDTADSYSRWKEGNHGGESEVIIGNWMKARNNRSKIILATKVGSDMGQGKSLKKQYILQSVDNSLMRLQTDYIDLYQSHFDDTDTPVDETMEAYAELIQQGKVRMIGASNLSAERLKASLQYSKEHGLPKYETLQPEYNLYNREKFEKEYKQICIDENLSVLPYSSLASGFLTGKYRSENDLAKSARGGGVKKYLNDRGLLILDALEEVAKYYDTTAATIALAWLMSKPAVAAPIASATNITQLNELISAANVELDKGAMEMLDKASEY